MSEIKTWDMRAGKRWPEASEIIEAMQAEINELRAALAERDALQTKITVLEGHAHAGLLEAFDAYARQFTYNNHPAKPEHFPKSFPWFSAGYSAAGAAPVPDMLAERFRACEAEDAD